MKMLLITLVGTVVSLGFALPGMAQSGALPQEGPLLWQGSVRQDVAPDVREVLALADAELSRRLAEIQVDLATTNDRAAAGRALAALRVRAARQDTADVLLLRSIAVIRTQLYLDSGRRSEALEALLHWLPDHAELSGMLESLDVVGPSAELLQRLADAAADPQLVQLRETFGDPSGEGAAQTDADGIPSWMNEESWGVTPADVRYVIDRFGTPTEEMTHVVHRKIKENAVSFIVDQLSAYAVPSLAFLALVTEDELITRFMFDPLAMLMRIDEGAALRLMQDRFEQGGAKWRRRVARAVVGVRLWGSATLKDKELWSLGKGEIRSPRCLKPARLVVIERLLGGELEREVLDALAAIARWDGFTPEIVNRLAPIVRNQGKRDAFAILEALDTDYRLHSAIPVYVAGLSSADADVRRECAARLSAFDPHPELLARVQDDDPELRIAVARSLVSGDVSVHVTRNGHISVRPVYRAVEHDQTTLAAVETLLTDEVLGVQQLALEALNDKRTPARLLVTAMKSSFQAIREQAADQIARSTHFERDELAGLFDLILSDPSPVVRRMALSNLSPGSDLDLQLTMVTRLASDPDPEVLAALDVSLANWNGFSPDVLVAALELRMAHPTRPFRPSSGSAENWRTWVWNNLRGSSDLDLVRLGLAHPSTGLLAARLYSVASTHRSLEPLGRLAPADLARLYAWAIESDFAGVEKIYVVLDEAYKVITPAMRGLLLDEQRSTAVRLAAGCWVPDVLWSPESRLALTDLLRRATPADLAVAAAAENGGPFSTAPDANAYLLEVLRDAEVTEAGQLWLASGLFDADGAGADEVARLVLERWMDAEESCVHAAIKHLATGFAGDDTVALLKRAAAHTFKVSTAVSVMADMTDPAVIPVLQQLLTSSQTSRLVAGQVLKALLRHGPAARDALRTGLLTFSREPLRSDVLRALEALDRFEADGADGGNRLATRDQAAVDLLAMLEDDSPAIRAEAAKGLATLGAVEALPVLIGLLGDPDEGVRAAVRESLDRLHAASVQ